MSASFFASTGLAAPSAVDTSASLFGAVGNRSSGSVWDSDDALSLYDASPLARARSPSKSDDASTCSGVSSASGHSFSRPCPAFVMATAAAAAAGGAGDKSSNGNTKWSSSSSTTTTYITADAAAQAKAKPPMAPHGLQHHHHELPTGIATVFPKHASSNSAQAVGAGAGAGELRSGDNMMDSHDKPDGQQQQVQAQVQAHVQVLAAHAPRRRRAGLAAAGAWSLEGLRSRDIDRIGDATSVRSLRRSALVRAAHMSMHK